MGAWECVNLADWGLTPQSIEQVWVKRLRTQIKGIPKWDPK